MERMNTEEPSGADRRGLLVERLRDVKVAASERSSAFRRRSWSDADRLALGFGEEDSDGAPDGPFPDGEPVDEEARSLALAIGMFMLAVIICDRTEGERGEKMARAGRQLYEALGSLLSDSGFDPEGFDDVFLALIESWSESDRIELLIDLAFSDPFFPYELSVKDKDFEFALRAVAREQGFRRDIVSEIRDTRRSASKAHRSTSLVKIGLFGAGGLLLVGAGAFAVAPILGASLGVAAGYSGAAATSYGLALLGGGSLASGGAGMAGGLWLVTGAGAAVGLVAGSGSTTLYTMGGSQARAELTRLQVSFKMTVLAQQVDTIKAQQVISSLGSQLEELRGILAEERQLNDDNSNRVKNLEAKIRNVEEALGWMNEQPGAAA